MKKSYIAVAALLSSVSALMGARFNQTPIPLLNVDGPYYYPRAYLWEDDSNWCVNFDASLGVYWRSIDDAYGCGNCPVPFTTLLFGASDFTLAQAYPNGSPSGAVIAQDPLIDVTVVSPRYSYDERGAVFGFDVGSQYCYCDVPYRFGLRARLPFRDVELNQVCNLDGSSSSSSSEIVTGSGVYRVRSELTGTPLTVPPGVQANEPFAVRLDFLNALNRIGMNATNQPVGPGVPLPMIEQNGAFLQIASTTSSVATPNNNNLPPVQVLYAPVGTVPTDRRWAVPVSTTGPIPQIPLDATGGNLTGVTDVDRAYFVTGTDYTALFTNPALSRNFWVVPSLQGSAGVAPLELAQGAQTIKSAIALAVQNAASSSSTVVSTQTGFSFCQGGRRKGLGDLDMELYVGRHWYCNKVFTEGMLGVMFPTSKDWQSCCNPISCLQPADMPLGTNGHYQLRLAGSAGYDMREWVKLSGYLSYSWVLRATEQIAAPFEGATIRNIGPCITARTSWEYFLGNVDATFMASECCGLAVGYQLYHQRCEKACLCQATAIPFLDTVPAPLDPNVFTANSNATAHKIRVGFFTDLGNSCNIFAGFSHVVGGKNIGRETDWYAQFSMEF